jgi:hypothetical protein
LISKSFAVMGALTLVSATAHAGSAPKELYGKSIIITWGEQHSQRMFGEANFRDENVRLSRTIYISTKGQLFDRFAVAGATAGYERIGASAPRREVQFSGRTIIGTDEGRGGLARKITVEFDESFATCEAHVIFAKQAGRDVVVGADLNTGKLDKEIRSATVTSTSCSVRDGNVFAQ